MFSESFVYNFTHGRLNRYLRSAVSPHKLCGADVCIQEVTTATFEDTVFNNEKVRSRIISIKALICIVPWKFVVIVLHVV